MLNNYILLCTLMLQEMANALFPTLLQCLEVTIREVRLCFLVRKFMCVNKYLSFTSVCHIVFPRTMHKVHVFTYTRLMGIENSNLEHFYHQLQTCSSDPLLDSSQQWRLLNTGWTTSAGHKQKLIGTRSYLIPYIHVPYSLASSPGHTWGRGYVFPWINS